MATKKAAKKASNKRRRRHIVPGDSPITVGGGAGKRPKPPPYVDLQFDQNIYDHDVKHPDNWVSENLRLVSVEMGASSYPAVNQVVFRYQGGGGKITCTGMPVVVTFKNGDLPYHNGHHHHDGFELKDFKIDNGPPIQPTADVVVHTTYIVTPPKRRTK
jgi:hypothetical protein